MSDSYERMGFVKIVAISIKYLGCFIQIGYKYSASVSDIVNRVGEMLAKKMLEIW